MEAKDMVATAPYREDKERPGAEEGSMMGWMDRLNPHGLSPKRRG